MQIEVKTRRSFTIVAIGNPAATGEELKRKGQDRTADSTADTFGKAARITPGSHQVLRQVDYGTTGVIFTQTGLGTSTDTLVGVNLPLSGSILKTMTLSPS